MAASAYATAFTDLHVTGAFYVNDTEVFDDDGNFVGSINLEAAAVTTGTVLSMDDANALTSGKVVHIASSATALTSAARLLLSDHTGNAGVSAVLNEFLSAAADETVILQAKASAALAAGKIVNVSGLAMTTGKAVSVDNLDALTTGIGVSIGSAATAITGAGRLFSSAHTGATGTSAILNEFASAANDETVVVKITASAALALGTAFQVSGAAVTTGTIIKANDADALTTGGIAVLASNSADTGTRVLLQVTNDNTAATGCTPLSIQNDATAGSHIKLTGTGVNGIDFTALTSADTIFNCTAGAGCTAAPQTNAAVGFINILVAGTPQWIPYYNAT